MPRIMAIDYGKKRTGIAVTDPLQMIATTLETIETKQLQNFLSQYLALEPVETLVIGKPYTFNFEVNSVEKDILQFIAWFNSKFPHVKVCRMDERFTSKIASQTILQSGVNKKKRQQKDIVDRVSATLILQSYLDSKNR
jgi:putative Holliday junction resolvase